MGLLHWVGVIYATLLDKAREMAYFREMSTSDALELRSELFPLDPVGVKRSLEAIRQDPLTVLVGEAAYFEEINPHLSTFVDTCRKTLVIQEMGPYGEAALTIHKLIREASPLGGELPMLDREGFSDLSTTLIGALTLSKRGRSSPKLSRVIRAVHVSALESEPSVLGMTRQLADHRLDRDAYYAGSATVVAGLRLAVVNAARDRT